MSIMYANPINTIDIMFNPRFIIYFFSKFVTTIQRNCIIFFQELLEFLLSVSMKVFISIKIDSVHEGDLRAKRIRNSGSQFFCVLTCTLGATRAPRRNVHLVIIVSIIIV